MFFKNKSKEDANFKLVNEVVMKYFEYIQCLDIPFTCTDISELLRYSVCKLLNLDSCSYSRKIEQASVGVVNVLKPLIESSGVDKRCLDYRHGFLESCVHCVEMSRKKVEG